MLAFYVFLVRIHTTSIPILDVIILLTSCNNQFYVRYDRNDRLFSVWVQFKSWVHEAVT